MRRPAPAAVLALALVAAVAGAEEPPAAPEAEGSFALRAGAVYTGGRVVPGGVLVVEGGKVQAVLGPDEPLPPGLPVLDRRHLVAAPGLVAAQLELGSGRRDDETLSARFMAADGFDPYAEHRRLLGAGITTAFLHPGRGRLVTGQGAVVKLGGPPFGRTLRASADLCAELGEAALDPPADVEIPVPSSADVPIVPGTPQRPTSRMGAAAELLARLRAALEYEEAREGAPAGERPELDLDLAALARAALDGRLRLDARRASELRAAAELAQVLGLRVVVAGATEAGQVLEALAGLGAPVVYELPFSLQGAPRDRGNHPDRLRTRLDTPARLAGAGLTFALVGGPGDAADLRLLAALAVRGGLDPARALAAVTRDAAAVLGVAERTGSLEAGKDADFVLLSGPPLATSSAVVETWVEGRRVYRAAAADAVVIRAGTIHTMVAPEPLRNGEVLLQGGAIAAVGSSVPHPRGARLIDAGPHGVVTPGFVDAYGHLGLRGDADAPAAQVPIHGVIGRETAASLAAARAGITTVLLAPRRLHGAGSRVAAIKTADGAGDDPRGGRVLRPTAGLAFDLTAVDPLELPGALLGRLKAGKAYHQRWAKYREALKRFEAQERAGKASAKAEEAPAPAEEGQPEGWTDPISGTWSYTVSGGPLQEPRPGLLELVLAGDRVTITGQASAPPDPQVAAVIGTLEGTKVSLTVELDTPMGAPRVEAELDAPDHLRGSLILGPFSLDFVGDRTNKAPPEIRVQVRRRRSAGGRPVAPPVDPSLEPLRLIYEGEAVLVLHVDDPASARTILGLLRKEKLPAVLVGLRDGDLVGHDVRTSGAGVVLRPEAQVRRGVGAPVEPGPVALAGERLRLGFMSGAEDGARELPFRALAAVAGGLSAGDALAALTIDAARLYRLEDRVGSLEAGKDADVLVWSGDPFEATSRLDVVIVGGRVVGGDE